MGFIKHTEIKGIKYGTLTNGRYTPIDANCGICGIIFPQLCTTCPNCSTYKIRRFGRNHALMLRNLFKQQFKNHNAMAGRIRNKPRPKAQIIQSILSYCKKPAKMSWIILHCRLSWARYNFIINELLDAGLLRESQENTFFTTEKGIAQLENELTIQWCNPK